MANYLGFKICRRHSTVGQKEGSANPGRRLLQVKVRTAGFYTDATSSRRQLLKHLISLNADGLPTFHFGVTLVQSKLSPFSLTELKIKNRWALGCFG